jgi:hypothetical protein
VIFEKSRITRNPLEDAPGKQDVSTKSVQLIPARDVGKEAGHVGQIYGAAGNIGAPKLIFIGDLLGVTDVGVEACHIAHVDSAIAVGISQQQ